MRSKKSKQRSAYWRGEKIVIFLRRGIIVLSVFVFTAVIVLGVKQSTRVFRVKDVLISGNYHLGEEDVLSKIDIGDGESLLRLSSQALEGSLKRDAWIKKVSLRRQFPDTLLIKIEEAVPKALLSFNKQMFLIDEDGNILEKIKGEGTPFLPVIKNINPKKDREGILEILKLIDVLNEKNIVVGKESVEIGLKSYGPVINIGGEIIKVGYGRYSEKFDRWKELESEVRKRGVPIKYVDLRFKDSVIVKPLKRIKKRS